MRLTDLRVIHAGLSVRAATAVQLALTGTTDPLAQQFANYLADELRAKANAPMPVTVISAEGVTTGLLNADDSITVPAPEPAAKRVARKMAKAGAKAAKA